MITADIIAAVSTFIAAITFACGVFAWKREFIGTRRIELGETVLSKFYEAEEAIRAIRNPMGWSEEGKSRQRSDHETPEDAPALNRAYVLFERRDKHRQLFADLQSLKFRYMATFGRSALEPFKDLCDVLNEMSSAANELGRCWWPREMRGQLSERDAAEQRKCEGVFWRELREDEPDEIAQRVNKAVHRVEDLLQDEVRFRAGWWRQTWQRCKRELAIGDRAQRATTEVGVRFTPTVS